jgi:hypothetical protein
MTEIRTDWTRDEIAALFDLPFNDLLFQAQTVHRQNFDPNAVQLSTLLSIKTGGCVEDCGYCSQSASHDTGLKATKLMDVRAVLQAAAQAKDNGSGRFCMGAAWRSPKDRDMPAIIEMVKGVRAMGMETCMTPRSSPKRGSITTTTISTPRRRITPTSYPPAASRTASTRSRPSARRGSMCAAAASSAWARPAPTASAFSTRSPPWRTRKACRSTRWCR